MCSHPSRPIFPDGGRALERGHDRALQRARAARVGQRAEKLSMTLQEPERPPSDSYLRGMLAVAAASAWATAGRD